jgi:signal transduction histidine kinase
MGERVKELRALYGTYEIIQAGGSVSEALQEIVNIIPLAWQYPEVTAARISLNGQEYKTSNFSKTQWVQRVDFSTVDGELGAIEVCYLKAMPNETEGPFLSEERTLINSLAKMLRIFLDKRYAETALLKAKTQAELYLDLMGHDITNMNQALVGNLEMLEMLSETGEIDRGLIASSLETINRSSRTIRDVKKLTQVLTGNVPQKVVDVCEMLSNVKSKYSAVPGRLVTVNYTPGENCPIKAGDMLEDVFDNLVDNAIRHSRGAVTVDLTIDQVIDEGRTYFRIAVADTGPGIPDALKKTLFLPFEELGGKAIRRGFGIYLVRTLVDYYHGKVWVEDRVPGDHTKGARFVVMLPAVDN